jgi:hypothetical protein
VRRLLEAESNPTSAIWRRDKRPSTWATARLTWKK